MDLIQDKIPPQAIELEKSLLGTLMEFPENLNDVRDILTVNCFYQEPHQLIYNAILRLDNDNNSIDLMLVSNKLKELGNLDSIGGVYYLTLLCDAYNVNGVEERALIIKEKFIRRELIRISSEVTKKSYNDCEDIFDIIAELSNQQDKLLSSNDSGVCHILDCVSDVLKVMDKNFSGKITGLLTGFTEYDNFSKGDQKGDLIVIAGETSQGKTALALCKAFNQALMGYKVAVFSYEMSKNQITARLMALATDVSAKKILMDKLEAHEFEVINHKINKLVDSNLYIIEVERNNFDWLKAKIKTIKSKYGIESIIIDYVQLISIPGLPKNQQVATVANELKFLAKHKNINLPITLLSQLARTIHPNKMPCLSRLKESGDIENAADTVIGIWRPEYYKLESVSIRNSYGVDEDISTKDIGIAHILKGRNIGLKDIILNWDAPLTKYSDYVPKEIPF